MGEEASPSETLQASIAMEELVKSKLFFLKERVEGGACREDEFTEGRTQT